MMMMTHNKVTGPVFRLASRRIPTPPPPAPEINLISEVFTLLVDVAISYGASEWRALLNATETHL